MKKIAKHLALAGAVALMLTGNQALAQATPAPAATPEPTPEHTLVPKISIYSEYEYRGISQTAEKPALQFNLDYAHSSGFYLGTFVTNIKWLKEAAKAGGFTTNANIEWDIFGGYKFEIVKDVTLDVGYLRYEYPSSKAFTPSPNTDEVYVGIASGPFSAKYSHSTSNLFGFANSKNSGFTEINWSQEVLPKVTANAHIGRQTVPNQNFGTSTDGKAANYMDYALTLGKDFGNGFSGTAALIGTDTKRPGFYRDSKNKDLGKSTLVVGLKYSF